MSVRSTTGCINCKTRRKKCDETHPQCQRCTKSGIDCKYEYVEGGVGKQMKRRTRPAPRPASELAKAFKSPAPITSAPCVSELPPTMAPTIVSSLSSTSLDQLLGVGWPNELTDFSFPNGGFDFSLPLDTDWHTSLQAPPCNLATTSLDTAMPPNPEMTSGQASLLQALLSLAQPEDVSSIQPTPQLDFSREPSWSSRDDDSDTNEDDDPEGVKQIICASPAMNSSVSSNALAYVLQNYATWVKYCVYDPLRMAKRMKQCIIDQFSSSEDARSRILLISSVMNGLNRSTAMDSASYSMTSMMYNGKRQNIALFLSTPPSPCPNEDRRNASRALDNTLEVIGIQLLTSSIASVMTLMEEAAPVFRRGCPEPPGQPIKFVDILLEPGINLRHFAVLDVALSVTTGRPMLCRYDVEFSLELCDIITSQSECSGLQWLHGLPDQYILLFAWMNTLKEQYGDRIAEDHHAKIEADLRNLRIVPSEGVDPALRIARMVVQECWRQAVYIYFYMAFCGAPASDPRVQKALKGFMRLMNAIQPGRNPDAFLLVPSIIAAVAMTRQRDRETVLRRLSALTECATPGTCGNGALNGMEDIWARCAAEGRVAVWSDLRVASKRISGI